MLARIAQLEAENSSLQSKLDGTSTALGLLVEQYNEAINLLDVSTAALEDLTSAIVEGAQ
ncbi:hypothetical protein D3C78_1941450 [compost metagenome]